MLFESIKVIKPAFSSSDIKSRCKKVGQNEFCDDVYASPNGREYFGVDILGVITLCVKVK